MIKYYIHLFTAIFLATTTWVAIAPPAYEKGGLPLAIIACVVTGLVELFGYLAYRQYQRGGENPYLYIAGFVLLGSALFTFWGAGLIKSWMTVSNIEQIEAQAENKTYEIRKSNRIALTRWQSGYEEFQRAQARVIEKLKAERNAELYRKTDSKYFADAYIGGRAAAYRRSKLSSSRRRLNIADKIWVKYNEKIEAARSKEYRVPKPEQESLSGVSDMAKIKKEDVVTRAKVTANMIRAVDIIGLIFSIFILISSDEDDYIPEHPWSEGALHSLHYIKESFGMRLSASSVKAYREQEMQYAFEQGKQALQPELEELQIWQAKAEKYIETLKKEITRNKVGAEEIAKAKSKVADLERERGKLEQTNSVKTKMLENIRVKYSELQQQSTRASKRVTKASKEASKEASNPSKKVSTHNENSTNKGRVARVSGVSKKASKRVSKLHGPIEYKGREYKNLASFKGTMRNVKARAKKTGREDLKEQYGNMQEFLGNLQSAVIKKLG